MYSSSGSNLVFAMIGYSGIPVPILPQFINLTFYHTARKLRPQCCFRACVFLSTSNQSFHTFHFALRFLLPTAASCSWKTVGGARRTSPSLDCLPELSREGTAVATLGLGPKRPLFGRHSAPRRGFSRYSAVPVPSAIHKVDFVHRRILDGKIPGRLAFKFLDGRFTSSFPYVLTSLPRCPLFSHSAQAIPSGSFPVSNVAVTCKFLSSTATTLLSPHTSTNAFDPSGTIKIPSGLFPSLSLFTSFLVFASSTTSSPPPASEISTCFPSGVNFNRFECFDRTFTVSFTFFVSVSIIVT